MPKPNRPQTCHGAVKEPMRNARTAAGFEPTPSKMPLCEAFPKASNGSKLRAQGMQNTSQQKCQKHKPEKMLPVTFGIHKTFLVASTLADSSPRQAKCPYAKLPKASNGSKLRAQGMQNTRQKKGSQKRCIRNPSTWCRNCWQRIRKGQTPLYKPSSGKPKTMRSQPFHTVPKLQLRSRKKKHR